jgi:hypothetical protein
MQEFKKLLARLRQNAMEVSKSVAAIRLRQLHDPVDPIKAFRGQGRGGATEHLITQRRIDAETGK